MTTSDLVSYSIMLNGEKAITHTSPHYAPLTLGKPEKITLPPIASYVSLTENNLNSLNTLMRNANATSPPLLTLLLALELPLLLPRLSSLEIYNTHQQVSAAIPNPLLQAEGLQKKRRQRLGPSCDNCRARKVKCNAEVVMLSREFAAGTDDIEECVLLLPEQKLALALGTPVTIVGDQTLVVSNGKLIKFKACSSCAGKALRCCFSKGFTKEDIVHSKRVGPADTTAMMVVERKVTPVKVVKKRTVDVAGAGTRKSSCAACRKRKVKCVMHTRLNKCVGCVKKDSTCSFEVC